MRICRIGDLNLLSLFLLERWLRSNAIATELDVRNFTQDTIVSKPEKLSTNLVSAVRGNVQHLNVTSKHELYSMRLM